MTETKQAPHSRESEMIVLGTMITSINSLNIGADGLNDSDFYFTEHKIIFQILKGFYCCDKLVDIHLVAEELKRQGKLKEAGGVSYPDLYPQVPSIGGCGFKFSSLSMTPVGLPAMGVIEREENFLPRSPLEGTCG